MTFMWHSLLGNSFKVVADLEMEKKQPGNRTLEFKGYEKLTFRGNEIIRGEGGLEICLS